LPRGLGDSPLSKDKKKRTRRSAQVLAATEAPPAATPAPTESATTWTASSSAPSYNDVFFQRRDGEGQDAASLEVPASTDTSTAASSVYADQGVASPAVVESPVPDAALVASIPVSETSASTVETFAPEHAPSYEPTVLPTTPEVSEHFAAPAPITEAAPVAVASETAPPLETFIQSGSSHTSEALPVVEATDTTPIVTAPEPTPAPAPVEKAPVQSQPVSEPKRGFFSRLFGKSR
jgi:hypothetical protein